MIPGSLKYTYHVNAHKMPSDILLLNSSVLSSVESDGLILGLDSIFTNIEKNFLCADPFTNYSPKEI